MSAGPEGWSDGARTTADLLRRARTALAYGGLDGVIQRPFFHETGTYPHFAVEARGCRITDSADRTYLDWSNGWGPVLLGYRHPAVEAAITEQLAAGPTLSLMHPVEVEVAERLIRTVPCAEMVAFGKNGSDALNAAVRVARAATGRDIVLQHGFHGFHEWYLAKYREVKGIPRAYRRHVVEFPYNDIGALDRLLRRRRGRVAAVVMEPVNTHLPEPGYLDAVRELAHAHGALFILDEVMTALRLHRGGAQALYGVEPDLACLGKSLGNGMPISALVGRREHMARLPSTGYGMTFRGETLSLAATRAVLDTVENEPVVEHLTSVGERVRASFEQFADDNGLSCRLLGPPARMSFAFLPRPEVGWEKIRAMFLQECLRHGVITNGTLLASYAHDDDAVDESVRSLQHALVATRERLERQTRPDRPIGGSPFGPREWRAIGFIDRLEVDTEHVDLEGWLLLDDVAPSEIEVLTPAGTKHRARRNLLHRLPLMARVPRSSPGSRASRFQVRLDRRTCTTVDGLEFTIRASSTKGGKFSCPVLIVDPECGSDAGPYPLGDGVLYL